MPWRATGRQKRAPLVHLPATFSDEKVAGILPAAATQVMADVQNSDKSCVGLFDASNEEQRCAATTRGVPPTIISNNDGPVDYRSLTKDAMVVLFVLC